MLPWCKLEKGKIKRNYFLQYVLSIGTTTVPMLVIINWALGHKKLIKWALSHKILSDNTWGSKSTV